MALNYTVMLNGYNNRYNLGTMRLIETPVAGQIENIVNMLSNCSSNNCLFLQKEFHGR